VRLHAHQLQHADVDAGNSVQTITKRHKLKKARITSIWLRVVIFRWGHTDDLRLVKVHEGKPRFSEVGHDNITGLGDGNPWYCELDKAALTEYQRVLMNNTEIAIIAAEQIKRYAEAVEEDSIALLWTFIHGFLVTVGNIAKLLYPENFHRKTGKFALTPFAWERGVQLRESLSIADQDSLFDPIKSNKARNYFEHFDDWLDTWASTSKTRLLLTSTRGEEVRICRQ